MIRPAAPREAATRQRARRARAPGRTRVSTRARRNYSRGVSGRDADDDAGIGRGGGGGARAKQARHGPRGDEARDEIVARAATWGDGKM